MLKDSLRNIAIFIKDKQAIVQKTAFSLLPKNTLRKPIIHASIANLAIIKD